MRALCCHTHFSRGKRVRVTLRDGTVIVDKYVERLSRFVVLENHKIRTNLLKSMTYARG